MKRVALILSIITLAFSVLSAAQQKPFSLESQNPPQKVLQWQNPYAGRSDAWRAGEKLFDRHCAQCHGDGGIGTDHAPSLKSVHIKSAKPGTLFWFVKNGNLRAGMPSWSRLPDAQVWQIVTYLLEIGDRDSGNINVK